MQGEDLPDRGFEGRRDLGGNSLSLPPGTRRRSQTISELCDRLRCTLTCGRCGTRLFFVRSMCLVREREREREPTTQSANDHTVITPEDPFRRHRSSGTRATATDVRVVPRGVRVRLPSAPRRAPPPRGGHSPSVVAAHSDPAARVVQRAERWVHRANTRPQGAVTAQGAVSSEDDAAIVPELVVCGEGGGGWTRGSRSRGSSTSTSGVH